MKIDVTTEELIEYGLDIDQYILCMCLYSGETTTLINYYGSFGPIGIHKLEYLIERKLIRSVSNSFSLSNLRLNEEIFLQILKREPIAKWISEWYDIWPKGVKSGGYYVRTDEKGCQAKMIKFMKRNPLFTKEIILEGTRRYIYQKSLGGYDYIMLAPNFIEKDGVSMLAGECENVLNEVIPNNRPKIVQGSLFGDREL